MKSKRTRIVGAVEIGTAKVIVLVAEIVNGRSLSIIGMGESSSRGIKKGVVHDLKQASHCVHAAIDRAEESAGTGIESIFLALSGQHLDGFFQKGTVNIAASDGLVTRSDVNRSEEEAKSRQLPDGRVYVHHIRNAYRVDGRAATNPLGMAGAVLEAGYWSVHADERRLRDMMGLINGYGLRVDDVIVSSIASGCVIASPAERQQGVLVLDLGCGTTDYVLYRGGHIARTGVVAVGGDHLTNDLALGLRLPEKFAEKQKLEHGHAHAECDDKTEKVWLIGDKQIGDRRVPKRALYQILEARIDELFEVVGRRLEGMLDPAEVPAGVVLTGGTARLPGISEVAGKALGLPVRLGEPPQSIGPDLRKPEYSTSLGLLHYALNAQKQEDAVAREGAEPGLLRRVSRMLHFAASEA